MKTTIQIAIDGPAAAGKSTVAKRLADRLSYTYIDTGAMYRAVTYKALQENLNLNDEEKINEMLNNTNIELLQGNNGQIVKLDGKDVTDEIRSEKVTNNVSIVAQHQKVRGKMVAAQRELASRSGVVMDGRDIGTHVLPEAQLKVFMKASVDERAERRYQEQLSKGIKTSLEDLKNEIALRDKLDSERAISPLMKADDAIEIDTTSLSIDEVTTAILNLVEERN